MLREKTHCHLRQTTQFLVDPIHSVFNNIESASFLGPKMWEQIPTEIKNKDFPVEFKNEIRKRKPLNYPCRICKTFIAKFYLVFHFGINIRICIFFHFIFFLL